MRSSTAHLILRSNRFLGSSLVDKGLVSSADLESANEKFMESIQANDLKRASILTSLLFELKALDENQLLSYTVEEHDLGMVDLRHVEIPSMTDLSVDLTLCWATSTIPFDKMGDTYLLASCYYLSAPVQKFWKEALGADVISVCDVRFFDCSWFERLDEIHAEEEAAAAEDAGNA